jgi:hypothetical protein
MMKTAKERIERLIKKWTAWIKEAEQRGDQLTADNYRLYRMGLKSALDILEDYDEDK